MPLKSAGNSLDGRMKSVMILLVFILIKNSIGASKLHYSYVQKMTSESLKPCSKQQPIRRMCAQTAQAWRPG
jgi:hypothetical protein